MKIKSTHPESQGDFVIIEDEDFNPETMVKYVESDKEPAGDGPTRDEMKTFLTEKGVQFAANISNAKLAELYTAEKTKAE